MSHRPRVPEGSQSFLTPEELNKKAKRWKVASADSEPAGKIVRWDKKQDEFVSAKSSNSKVKNPWLCQFSSYIL